MLLYCDILFIWMLVTLLFSVITLIYGSEVNCPSDVTAGIAQCLRPYEQRMDAFSQAYRNFYTGVDVEVIRMICSELRRSGRCLKALQSSCPATDHSEIKMKFIDNRDMIRLCSTKKLYEVYAQHQFCYRRMSAPSETCYNRFHAEVRQASVKLAQGETNVIPYICQKFDSLMICVKTNVRLNCGTAAGTLSTILVRPSLATSRYCHNDTLTAATTTPHQTPSPFQPSYSIVKHNLNSSFSTFTTRWRTFLLLPVFNALYLLII